MARRHLDRRRVFWHIGPDDPGTAFIADALQRRRDELSALGVAVPGGRWHEIEDQVWGHKGLSLVSTPEVARAGNDRVALRLSGLRDVELHLVVLVRDLPTQVHAGWQESLRHGSTTSLERYTARVLDPARRHWQAEEFWAGRDLSTILPRWTRAVHADRVRVVAAPADPDGVWRAFLEQAGIGDLVRPAGFAPPIRSAKLDAERVLEITTAWSKLVADRGFDLSGSLIAAHALTAPVAGHDDQALAELLAATTTEVERLGAEVTALRIENRRLDRKRRKHKRRLAQLQVSTGG